MYTRFDTYVLEQTHPDEIERRIENERLVRQACGKSRNDLAFGRLLVRSGRALMNLGSRLQGSIDDKRPAGSSRATTVGAD